MLAGIITDYAFGLGYMSLAGIAYMIRDWRKLQLAISAPGFLLIFYIWWEIQCTSELPLFFNTFLLQEHICRLCDPPTSTPSPIFAPCLLTLSPVRVVPQSARWLLANDRREEAIALLRKAALVNGRVLPPTVQVRLHFPYTLMLCHVCLIES